MTRHGNLSLIVLVALIFSIIAIIPVSGQDNHKEDFGERFFRLLDNSNTSVTVFYSTGCSACKVTLPKIAELSKDYPDVQVNYINIFQSNENRTIMLGFGQKYEFKYPALPALYTGDITVLEGGNEIEKYMKTIFEAQSSGMMPDYKFESELRTKYNPEYAEENDSVSGSTTERNKNISWIMVIFAGLADGINPCALSVLALLLVSLTNLKSRSRIILNGLAYTFAVFLFYTIAGLGILTIIQAAGISSLFSVFAGFVALAAGIITFVDGISGRSLISPGISGSGKPAIKKIMERASLPAAFALGIMVGLFELPCTGGIYIAILGLLSTEYTFYEGLPYLLLYNLMFIVPLVVIILAVAYGLPPEKVDTWRDSNKKLLRTGIGLMLIAMGIYILTVYLL